MPEDNTQRAWHFRQLTRSLRDLVSAGSDQLALFPGRTVKPDELAWAFGHWATAIRSAYEAELSDAQAETLAAVERKFATMSRDGAEFGADLWTESALRTSEHWIEVRNLATAALDAFESPIEMAGET